MGHNDQQHIVPVMHLERFADALGKVLVVDRLDRSKTHRQKPGKVARQRHFYSVPGPDGALSHIMETKVNTKIEGDAKPAIDRMLRAGIPPGNKKREDRSAIAAFIALQGLRGWDAREDIETLTSHFAKVEMSSATQENLRQCLREVEGRDSNEHVRVMTMYLMKITDLVYNRAWTLLESNGPALPAPAFLTSDAPVGRWSESALGSRGWISTEQITIPLDRRHALLLTHGPRKVARRQADYGTVLAVNMRTALYARRWLIHHPEDDPPMPKQFPGPPKLTFPESGRAVMASTTPTAPRSPRGR